MPGWTLSRLTNGGEDLTLTNAGGAGRIFETQAVAIQGGSDGPTGYMVLLHDVTERRAAAATIRESEQRYRQLVENAHDLIFTCDLSGHLRSINRAGLAATGFARDEIVGLSIPISSPPRRGRVSWSCCGRPATAARWPRSRSPSPPRTDAACRSKWPPGSRAPTVRPAPSRRSGAT